jgi:hypothetical protein
MARPRAGLPPPNKWLNRSGCWRRWPSMRPTNSHGRRFSHWKCKAAAIRTPAGIFRPTNLQCVTNSPPNSPTFIALMPTCVRTARQQRTAPNAKQPAHRRSDRAATNSITELNENRTSRDRYVAIEAAADRWYRWRPGIPALECRRFPSDFRSSGLGEDVGGPRLRRNVVERFGFLLTAAHDERAARALCWMRPTHGRSL